MASKKGALPANFHIGLSDEEIDLANAALSNSTQMPPGEQAPLYELYVLGYSFQEIATQYPRYSLGHIILTAAQNEWYTKREQLRASVKDRVQAQVSKAVIEQVEFLTSLFTVATVDNVQEMKQYVADPVNNKRPKMAINSLKEYKEAVEMLAKVLQSVSGNPDTASLTGKKKKKPSQQDDEIIDIKALAGITDDE